MSRDWPIRATLLAGVRDHHTLVIVLHHLASDAWSRAVVRRDLLATYRELCGGPPANLPALDIQACDIAHWQTRRLQHRRATQLAYWQEVFADLPEALSLAGPPTHPPANRTSRSRAVLERDDQAQFVERCRSVGLTEFEVLLAAVMHGLARFATDRDVVVGVPVCVRNRPELTDQVGYYVSMVPVRARMADALTTDSALDISRRYRVAQRHADVPLADIVGRVDRRPATDRRPLFDVVKRDLEPHLSVEPLPLHARTLDVPTALTQGAVLVNLTTAVGKHREIVIE
jgi:hypothetical protein